MATILRRLLAEEDDCAPDAYIEFEWELVKHTGLDRKEFEKASTRTDNDAEMTISHLCRLASGEVFEVEWSHDDPYWKLYEHIETTSVKVKI